MTDRDLLPRARSWLAGPADIAAIVGLALLVAIRWWKYVASEVPLVDEAVYLSAFEALAAGRSPYSVEGYYYPTAFARVGGAVLERIGQSPLLFLMRAMVLLSLTFVVWLSLSCWPMKRAPRFLVAALYVLSAPAVGLSLVFGNVSFVVIALVILAFYVWGRRPWLAGLLLGSSVAIKPLAPLAVLALAVHRPKAPQTSAVKAVNESSRLSRIPAHWIAAAVAIAFSALVLLPPARLLEMTGQPITGHNYFRTISLHRILALVDLEVSPLVVAILVALAVLVVCRWRPLSETGILCVATAAAIMAAPVIWAHTLVLVLPMQVIALCRAFDRRTGVSSPGLLRRYEPWFVVLAVAALQFAKGTSVVDLLAAPYQMIALSVPYLAAPALAAYVVWTSE